MMRSLYSAISGLKNHQIKMDVIGNNIANVNTTGFKRSRVSFATTLSQTLKGASTPSQTLGGTNPTQVGMGAVLSSIDQIMTQGSSQSTSNPTDMMIQGSGFFILDNNGTVYSRAGAFSLDGEGNLIDPGSGAKVQGYMYSGSTAGTPGTPATPGTQGTLATELSGIKILKGSGLDNAVITEDPITVPVLDSYSIDAKGVITGKYITPAQVDAAGTVTTPSLTENFQIGQIALANFANDAGLENMGNNFYSVTPNSGAVSVGTAGSVGRGSIVTNTVEMSNVDLSTEFTDMIVAQRGFQANSRVITVSDSLLEELINLKRS